MHHKYILLDVGFSPSLTSACLDQSSLLLFLHEGHLKGEFDIQTQNGNSITIPTALSQLAHLAEDWPSSSTQTKTESKQYCRQTAERACSEGVHLQTSTNHQLEPEHILAEARRQKNLQTNLSL